MTFVWPLTLIPEHPTCSKVLLTKYGSPGSLFVKQVAFLMVVVKLDILPCSDLFPIFDPKYVIDFCSCLVNPRKMQQIPSKSDLV